MDQALENPSLMLISLHSLGHGDVLNVMVLPSVQLRSSPTEITFSPPEKSPL